MLILIVIPESELFLKKDDYGDTDNDREEGCVENDRYGESQRIDVIVSRDD